MTFHWVHIIWTCHFVVSDVAGRDISDLLRTLQTFSMPQPTPRRTTCATCGDTFPIGWGIRNHLQSSPCFSPATQSEDTGQQENVGNGEPVSMTQYMDTLADRGTLDPAFLHTYASWGPRGVDDDVAEAAKFLRCTEVGCGTSRRQAQTFLDYAKSIGGRAESLPKNRGRMLDGN